MTSCCVDGEAAAEMLERRWFAAFKAASAARSECEALLEQLAHTEGAWRQARAQLCELEAMRDALGDELEELRQPERTTRARDPAVVMSAA